MQQDMAQLYCISQPYYISSCNGTAFSIYQMVIVLKVKTFNYEMSSIYFQNSPQFIECAPSKPPCLWYVGINTTDRLLYTEYERPKVRGSYINVKVQFDKT